MASVSLKTLTVKSYSTAGSSVVGTTMKLSGGSSKCALTCTELVMTIQHALVGEHLRSGDVGDSLDQ